MLNKILSQTLYLVRAVPGSILLLMAIIMCSVHPSRLSNISLWCQLSSILVFVNYLLRANSERVRRKHEFWRTRAAKHCIEYSRVAPKRKKYSVIKWVQAMRMRRLGGGMKYFQFITTGGTAAALLHDKIRMRMSHKEKTCARNANSMKIHERTNFVFWKWYEGISQNFQALRTININK